MPLSFLESRITGCLYGGALGDALGAPVEGMVREEILKVHGGPVRGFVTRSWKNPKTGEVLERPLGRTTDDTHFKNLLCKAIINKNGRVDAEDFAQELTPNDPYAFIIMRMALLKQQSFKILYNTERVAQPHIPVVDTAAHHGGRGLPPANGAVMMISPMGLLYPGHPREAYLAGYEVACAIQQGYSADMAGVVAAGVAAALVPDTDIKSVIGEMVNVAPASVKVLLEDTVAMAEQASSPEEFYDAWLAKFERYFLDPGEAVSVAVGCLCLAQGEFSASTLNAVNYGRDADSIATTAGAIAGALNGVEALPTAWMETLDEAVQNEVESTTGQNKAESAAGWKGTLEQAQNEPSQSEMAAGVYKAVSAELSRTKKWADQYQSLL